MLKIPDKMEHQDMTQSAIARPDTACRKLYNLTTTASKILASI